MPAMKKTLIQIIQDILSATDGEPIESIADSLEGEQAAQVVEEVFYDIVLQDQPEHESLIKLTPASDNNFPTHFYYPENVTDIKQVWYDNTEALVGTGEFMRVQWCEPLEFIRRSDSIGSASTDFVNVVDKQAGTNLRIRNNRMPRFYTSFDDYWIVMDAYHSSYDDSLQQSKVRAFGRTFPVFDRFDNGYIPDLDAAYFTYLTSESKARYMDQFKGGVTQKAEQAARRARSFLQNDKFRTLKPNKRVAYGRHR